MTRNVIIQIIRERTQIDRDSSYGFGASNRWLPCQNMLIDFTTDQSNKPSRKAIAKVDPG
jgi:hypothetical protein